MVGFNELLQRSSLPRSNRQYVPPLLLARGRGRRLAEMYTKGDRNDNSHIGEKKKSSVDAQLSKSHVSPKKNPHTTSNCGVDDEFEPLFPSTHHGSMGTIGNMDPPSPELDQENFEHYSHDGALSTHEDHLHHMANHDMPFEHQVDIEVQEHCEDMHQDAIDNSKKRKAQSSKGRGKNKCKAVAKLKPGEKFPITFYQNSAVGENYNVFSRHLGCIVRDGNICPIRVRKWSDIGPRQKEHIWAAITEVFYNENIEAYKTSIFKHMNRLWNNWRSSLLSKNVKEKKISLQAALKHVPEGIKKDDWAWLIKEHYSSDRHKKASERNAKNRSQYSRELLHRTGSMPIPQLIWDKLGGKEGKQPKLLDVYEASHKKGNDLVNDETTKKCIADKVFKSKSRSRVVGHGGGVSLKEIRDSGPSKAELQVELNAAKRKNDDLIKNMESMKAENEQLKRRQDSVEADMKKFQDFISLRFNFSIPPTTESEHGSPGV